MNYRILVIGDMRLVMKGKSLEEMMKDELGIWDRDIGTAE